MKKKGWNGIISQDGKPIKEEVEIEEKMDGRKKNSGKQAKKDNEDRRAAQRKRLGILGPNEDHDKTECPKCKGEGCEHCDGKGYHINEEVVVEDWIDNDARKVERKWSKMDKKSKKKWIDKALTKAEKEGMSKAELMDVLDDYGLTMEEKTNLDKLKDWGIGVKNEGYMILPAMDRDKYTPIR